MRQKPCRSTNDRCNSDPHVTSAAAVVTHRMSGIVAGMPPPTLHAGDDFRIRASRQRPSPTSAFRSSLPCHDSDGACNFYPSMASLPWRSPARSYFGPGCRRDAGVPCGSSAGGLASRDLASVGMGGVVPVAKWTGTAGLGRARGLDRTADARPALVVPGLSAWVREEHRHLAQAGCRKPPGDQVEGIAILGTGWPITAR